MKQTKTIRFFAIALLFVAFAGAQSAAAQPCSGPYLVEQRFPTTGTEETRWRVCWQPQRQFGLVITGAWFKKKKGTTYNWMRILWDARVGEMFVPYHGNQNRFYDIQGFNWPWVKLQAADCPTASGGTLLGPGPDACKIVRQRGLAWKYYNARRIGEELVLWGAIGAANYNYIVEWVFRDDGTVIGRVAATGPNFPGHPTVNHMHTATWRLDIDLNGWWNDSVFLSTHTEVPPSLIATDTAPLITQESGLVWQPTNFHSLLIGDSNVQNNRGTPSQLRLMPLRYGSQRHAETFTQSDFWVTRYNWREIYARFLPNFVSNNQPVNGKDIVVWYSGGLHHSVRDEDRTKSNGWMALAMWAQFQLRPHNLFDNTPLYP